MKSIVSLVVMVSVSGCAVGVQPPYALACQHWASCVNSQTTPVSADQCEQAEAKSYYSSAEANCQMQADTLYECLTTMPCEGFSTSTSEQQYCGKEMQALSKCGP